MTARRLYITVALCAVVVYLGALWNKFALDDLPIIVVNPLVTQPSGLWRAFAAPYWTPELGGHMYRPLVIAGFALDALVDGTLWFHAVNLLWHAGAAVAVAALARRWIDTPGGLVAGLLFAVHPVHVEAVANVVGRAELMAAVFVVLAVYAALGRAHAGWSAAALAFGLLSKENAAGAPALVVWAWILGLDRPDRRRMLSLLVGWVLVGAAYAAVRTLVRQPFGGTLVTSPLDVRFAAGLFCALAWGALLFVAWKRGRKLEAFGLGWIGVALLPVANLLYPAGFYVAERTLYLPSAGLVLAASAALSRLPADRLRLVVAVLCLLGGVRTALRVPTWRDDNAVTQSILEDSPDSYGGPVRMAGVYLDRHEPAKALAAARIAGGIAPYDPWVYATGTVAALAMGDSRAADSLLARLERFCSGPCAAGYLRYEATMARAHGYPGTADSLRARAARVEPQ